jgi:ribosomal-protein-alanine N-acetyltransferase
MIAPTELRTRRLVLRQFRTRDVADALEYRNDREFARVLPHIPQPFTQKDAEAFVKLNMSEPWQRSPTFAVVFEGTLIGTVNLEVDVESRTAVLGYAIGRAWWNQGLATEAAEAAMAWAVEALGLLRIEASTDVRHLRSQRVMEKLGLRREGLRDRVGRDGERIEEVVYGRALIA